jgi:hypothetical protein
MLTAKLIFVAVLWLFLLFAILWWIRKLREPGDDSVKDISGPYDETGQILSEMPPPRPVRMNFRGKTTAIMIPAILIGLAAVTSHDYFHPVADWQKEAFVSFFRFASALAIVLGLFLWFIYLRHKRLVRDGEVAIGRITRDYGRARNGQYVRYEFQTQLGDRFSKVRISWDNLVSGMRVPIFYDRQNPKTQIASFAAYYEVPCTKKPGANPKVRA